MYVLSSKVTRPVPPPQVLDRPRLYALLDQWQTTPIIFVHAPAGYGKSVLVGRWLEVRGLTTRTAWLSLDPGDDDPQQFVRYLAAALDSIAPGIAAKVHLVLDAPEPQPNRALEVLLGALENGPAASVDEPLLLVLDDLHQVDLSALAPVMTLFLERRPSCLRVLLLGRRTLYGPLVRLYAADQVLDVSESELRFRPDEMANYLNQRGFPSLPPSVLARLAARTEGWIVALQLLAVDAGNTLELEARLVATESRRNWLAQYLTTQILARFSHTQTEFLLRTSILERFNESLAAAVTGNQAADVLLSTTIEAGLPVVQLDSRNEWFRYHHLFQELLQTQLQQELDGAAIAALHRRAATWLAEQEQITAAVRHALAADDLSLAAAILESVVRPEILRGGTQQAQSWLSLFPNDALDQYPRLLLDLCLLGMIGLQADLAGLVTRADVALVPAQMADEERQQAQDELSVYAIYAQYYKRDYQRVRALVRESEPCLANAAPLTLGWFWHMQMHLAWYEGKPQHAVAKGNQAIEAFWDAGFDQVAISIRHNQAQITATSGHTRQALAMYREITSTAQPNSSFAINELVETHASAISLHYWTDDIEGVMREQQSALALAHRLADPMLIRLLTSLGSLFAMAGATGGPSEEEDSWLLDTMGSVLPLNRLHLHQLVRQGRVERAWHLAVSFGVQIDGRIVPENLAYFVSLLEATIARGIDLEDVPPRIKAAMNLAERVHSRFLAAELHALSSWCHLQMEQRERAELDLVQAMDLAVDTGYVRFILDIPALAPLLAVADHPAAGQLWTAAVPESVRHQAARLTPQERRVLAYLAQPARYQDIADSLGISINTVRTHIRHVYAKLSVTKRQEAVARAHALGLSV